jgi:hypothetical protein
MVFRSGGCATTGFALEMGSHKDPIISLWEEMVAAWTEVLAQGEPP